MHKSTSRTTNVETIKLQIWYFYPHVSSWPSGGCFRKRLPTKTLFTLLASTYSHIVWSHILVPQIYGMKIQVFLGYYAV